MKRLIKFIIKNFLLLITLPVIVLVLCNILTHQIYPILTILTYIYGMLLFGFGRAVGQGMYFQTKQGKPIPQQLIDTVKSAKYHTFTLVQQYGVFLQFLNIYLSHITLTTFIYMIMSSFIIYYFVYARVYNYIRGRQWYNKQSMYQVMILGKVRWISYPSKKMSLILTIVCTFGIILQIIHNLHH